MLHPGDYSFNYPQTKADVLKIHTDLYTSTLSAQNCKILGDKSLDNGKKIQSLTESTTHPGQLSSRINSWLLNTGNEDQSSSSSGQLQEDNLNSENDSNLSIRVNPSEQVCCLCTVLCKYTHMHLD